MAKIFYHAGPGDWRKESRHASRAESQRDSIHQPRVDEAASLPWVARDYGTQPQRGCIRRRLSGDATPLGLENIFDFVTQGRHGMPTLGWRLQSRWDCSGGGQKI